MEKKIAIVLGTRPEIIKFWSIIKECETRGIEYFVIHTGQHYSHNMDEVFFKQLKLKEPKYKLEIKSHSPYMQGEHTGKMMMEIEKILLKEKPTDVLVEGDTNTVLAAALVTSKISTVKQLIDFSPRLGHVEACLRSYDREMPEEMNRVITDHVSDFLFTPTENAKSLGLKENLDEKKIRVTGNTVVDALEGHLENIKEKDVLSELGLEEKKYGVMTLHRQENADVSKRFELIFKGIEKFYEKEKIPIVYPIHPRARKMLETFGLKIPKGIKCVDALGYFEFLNLEKNAAIALTDSGGVQEECCIFNVPCVTLRKSTERPETVYIGANIVAGYDSDHIAECCEKMLHAKRDWKQPFGDGQAGKKIVDVLLEK